MKEERQKIRLKSVLKGLLSIAVLVALGVSCSDGILNSSEEDKARMNVHLTDAPGDYQEVNVNITGMRIRYSPGADTSASDSTDEEGEWIDLPVEPLTLNLLELQNGVDSLLASAELDPGFYNELRLILGDDNTVMVDSSLHDLKVPSGQQSGYKIKFETELNEGDEIDVVVDFDAARSVHRAGNSGMYILKPVLNAFVENGGGEDTGSVSGTIEPVEADPDVFAIMDEDTSSTRPDSTGEFLIRGLEEGLYRLWIDPSSDQYSDTTLTDIMVEEDEETDVGTVTLNGNE